MDHLCVKVLILLSHFSFLRGEDIDECVLGSHNCGPEFLCTNTAGSFRCHPRETCGTGFVQDAAGSCIDINECVVNSSPCPRGQTCVNALGSYTCRQNTVAYVDECRAGVVCGGHGCVNLLGSYRCECRPGFLFNTIARLCEDINECRHYPGRLCAHKCDNTEGSYLCSCSTGFQLSVDGRNCEDVNECEANPCSQECANVYGSYQCYCRRGYQLSDIDGITCEDIDECALPSGGHMCAYRCANAPGSFYCTCPAVGYTIAANGRTCQDIDECAAGSHTCSGSQSCFNLQGDFRCLSFDCPLNFLPTSDGPRSDSAVNVRCVKSCPPRDLSCNLDPVHMVTHTVISLPASGTSTSQKLDSAPSPPAAAAAAAADVDFEIMVADEESSFDVVKRSQHNMVVGVVRQVKPLVGPRAVALEVGMNYVRMGVVSHRNIVVIHVFVSEFWF
ncbi:hypothetical protein CRUP_006966 [Coryphaenoides rupestris]|nr:hypothetical protein CRUP_006966 [Coryphaenoides rupestris]